MSEHKNTMLWALIGVVALVIILGGFGMGGYGMMGAGMGFGFLFMLLFWGAIIWVAVSLINANQGSKKDDSDSMAILKGRYAKGEITKKEFEGMKRDIQ